MIILKKFTNSKIPFVLLIFVLVLSIAIAHLFFQKYLFMPPCVKCIAIRTAMFIMIFGAFLGLFEKKFFKIFSFLLIFGGIFWGTYNSFTLGKIKSAKTSNLTITLKCGENPKILQDLGQSMPNLFMATGECGEDAPIVEKNSDLSNLQKFFLELYSDGFYLFPKQKILSLPQVCTGFFVFIFVVFCFVFGEIFAKNNKDLTTC